MAVAVEGTAFVSLRAGSAAIGLGLAGGPCCRTGHALSLPRYLRRHKFCNARVTSDTVMQRELETMCARLCIEVDAAAGSIDVACGGLHATKANAFSRARRVRAKATTLAPLLPAANRPIAEHSSVMLDISRYFPKLTERRSLIWPIRARSRGSSGISTNNSGTAFRYSHNKSG
ncbi:hypothetical protein SD70_26770 [Gordoniibacillus kamchatkensis]|uniref:Uncharacterized protein n=1 Tax=Gordoniibacillus kamchatkensis TaxID=1590651 RepID=A0ABR5ABG2_9BACL|nr:hypothetical protein SD70_26770 [Paenibacillus sp. VKM B-2647]